MKKIKRIGILCIVLLFFTGCSEKEVPVDPDTKQLLEVLDANDSVIQQTTDNEAITKLIENEKYNDWTEVPEIPKNSKKLYSLDFYALITEDIYLNDMDSNISYNRETLYKDEANYYIESVVEDETYYKKIPSSAGDYIVEFAQQKSDSLDKEKIFSEWEEIASNTGEDKPSSLGKKTISNLWERETQDSKDGGDDVYTAETIKIKKVEVIYSNNTVTITDLDKIADFYNELEVETWAEIDSPLSNESKVCEINSYQPKRKTLQKKLIKNEQITIYQDDDSYWAQTVIPPISSDDTEMKTCYEVPQSVADYISNL